MSLGSRILKRGRAAIYAPACPASIPTPREPLLFLYPQWTRTVTTATKTPLEDGTGEKADGHSNASPPGLAEGHINDISGRERGSSTELWDAPGDRIADPGHRHIPAILDRPDWHRNGQAMMARRLPQEAVNQSDPKQSKVSMAVRRILMKHDGRKVRAKNDERVRREYQEKKLEAQGHILPDWRTILRELDLHTPARSATWHQNALRLKIPTKAVGELLFHPDNNIWKIKDRTGCHIDLTENWDMDEEGHRALVLSGPVTCIAKAAAEITQITPKARSDGYAGDRYSKGFGTEASPREPLSENKQGVKTRYVAAEYRKLLASPIRADKLPMPATWNQASFEFYVARLTSMKIPNHLHRFLYPSGQNHVNAVVEILRKIFIDPDTRGAISTAAFNDALVFLVKHNQMEDVRVLFVHMQMQQLRMDTETFNIMLRGAAKTRDLHNFHFLLSLLLKRGQVPDVRTWVAFIMAVDNFQIKLHILTRMKAKELLNDHSTIKNVCENLVADEINWSLDEEKSTSQFFLHMSERYGADWLTVSSGNRIINALAARGLISKCWDFIEFMHSKDVKSNLTTINTILFHCKEQRNHEGSVEIISRISELQNFVPDEKTYERLFIMAWDSGLYNVARVVWRYACLDAATTSSMRARVRESLVLALSPNPALETRGEFWKSTAGLFIIGPAKSGYDPAGPIRPQSIGDAPTTDLVTPTTATTMPRNPSSTATTTLMPPTQQEQLLFLREATGLPSIRSKDAANATVKKSKEIFNENLNIFKTFRPQRYFADVLREALEADHAWRLRGRVVGGDHEGRERVPGKNNLFGMGSSTEAMRSLLDSAVAVPVCRRLGDKQQVCGSQQWEP
jgi:hypothetical protein